MRAPLVFIAVIAVSGVATAELGKGALPSPVVFPAQTIPLSFSHSLHLGLEAVDCATCHTTAASSTRASDKLIPPEAVCSACHDIDRAQPMKAPAAGKAKGACKTCHPGWNGEGAPPRIVLPPPHLKFNHKQHAAEKIDCATCHGDVERVGLATRAQLPRMKTCLGCHDGKRAPSKCTTCHIAEAGGRLKTTFPEGQLAPSGTLRADSHDLRFGRDHADAGRDTKYCDSCHTRSFCTECHDGKAKPMDFHGGDYQLSHAVDARRNDPDCSSCHRKQSFCTGCHARAGVAADAKTGEFADGRLAEPNGKLFHPEGWADDSAGKDHHATQARRNIRTCASCHREDFCMTCHSAEAPAAVRTSPHPPGWTGSKRCETLADKNPRMCLKCHVEGRTCEM